MQIFLSTKQLKKEEEKDTTESEAITSNDAGLDDSVLLPSEGADRDSQLGQEASPRLNKEEAQQTSSDVQRRDDPNGEIELVGDDTEEGAHHGAHHQPSDGDLIPPFRNPLLRLYLPHLPGIQQQGLRYLHRRSVFYPHLSSFPIPKICRDSPNEGGSDRAEAVQLLLEPTRKPPKMRVAQPLTHHNFNELRFLLT